MDSTKKHFFLNLTDPLKTLLRTGWNVFYFTVMMFIELVISDTIIVNFFLNVQFKIVVRFLNIVFIVLNISFFFE